MVYKTFRLLGILGLLLLIKPPTSAAGLTTQLDSTIYLPVIFQTRPGSITGCAVFPSNNIWNTPIDSLPVHPQSNAFIASIGQSAQAHADFGAGEWPPGSGSPTGIPFITVPGTQAMVSIYYTDYGDESDPGPFPIPTNAPIEGGPASDGDRHVLVIDRDRCKLYELFNASPNQDGSWDASSGAVFDLTTNGPLRPSGWTSADAAGLPIFPGLVRYDEVASGEILHALRFTARDTQDVFVWPARHEAGSYGTNYPPMGQRFRLKASFNISAAPAQVRPILTAMKKYGIILADNGSPWYFSGVPDSRWDNDALHWMDSHLSGMNFEAVDATTLMVDPKTGQATQP